LHSAAARVLLSPAGPLAWANGRAGLAGPSPAHVGCAGPSPKKIKNKKIKIIKNRKCRYKNFACLRKLYIFFLLNLFTYIRIMNKKGKRKKNILIFW